MLGSVGKAACKLQDGLVCLQVCWASQTPSCHEARVLEMVYIGAWHTTLRTSQLSSVEQIELHTEAEARNTVGLQRLKQPLGF